LQLFKTSVKQIVLVYTTKVTNLEVLSHFSTTPSTSSLITLACTLTHVQSPNCVLWVQHITCSKVIICLNLAEEEIIYQSWQPTWCPVCLLCHFMILC